MRRGAGPTWGARCAQREARLLALAIIVAGGVALRMYGLYGRSMWFDEGFSWRTIQFPVSEMIERIGRDNHPPLYFILLKLWTAAFGESLVALRSMNLAVSALAMAGIYLWAVEAFARNGDRARARWIGLVAAALFAVSTYQIRAAWEVRMYAMGTALVALSTWLLLRACSRPCSGGARGRPTPQPRWPSPTRITTRSIRSWARRRSRLDSAGRVVREGRGMFPGGKPGCLDHNRWAAQVPISPLPRRAFLRPSSVDRTPAGMTSPGHFRRSEGSCWMAFERAMSKLCVYLIVHCPDSLGGLPQIRAAFDAAKADRACPMTPNEVRAFENLVLNARLDHHDGRRQKAPPVGMREGLPAVRLEMLPPPPGTINSGPGEQFPPISKKLAAHLSGIAPLGD